MRNWSFNLFKYIGWRHTQLRPVRTLLTTLGVCLGIALYVAIAIINESTKNSLRESIESVAGKASLTISAGNAGFAEDKLEIVRTLPGVKAAVPMIEARAFFEGAKESNEGLYILGVDLLQESAVRTYQATDQKIIDDPLTFLNQPDSIVFTQELAKKRNLDIDSKIKLSTANGLKTFTVRGLLKPEGPAKAYGGSLAIMDIDGARMMFGKENKIDRIDIVPAAGVATEDLKKTLATALGDSFTIESPEAKSEQMDRLLSSYQMILTFFSSLALMVGLFLVMNSISVAIAERKREIGTLRALGATRFSMVYLFVAEVFGIGLIGSILGCVVGRVMAEKLVTQVTASVSSQLQTRFEVTNLQFASQQILMAISVGTLAAVLAALIPALKAADIHPLESMKKHAESFSAQDESRSRWMVAFGFLLLVFATLSLIFQWGTVWIGIDVLTKASTVFGAALFGPFLVFGFIHATRFFGKNTKVPTFKLALENLIRSRKRTTSNVMSVMVGLFLVMLITTVRASFHETLTGWLNQIFVADILVASSGRMIVADVQPIREELQDELLTIPGVRAIESDRGIRSRVVPQYYDGKKMVIKAFDHYPGFYDYKPFAVQNGDPKKIAPLVFNGERNVLLSDTFLNKHHKKVGESVEFDTPNGKVEFKIVGSVADFASPQGVIYMSRENYKKYWNDHLVTAFLVNLAPGYTLEQVRAAIDERVGKKWNVVTISNAEFKMQMEQAIERNFAYTKAIELVSLLVGLLGLLNTLLISVMERTREIGMLRAVGSTRSQVGWMILLESLLQGLFGSIVAILLGGYIGKLFVDYGLSSSLGWIIQFHFPRESLVQTLMAGMIVSMLAGLLPAKKAANLEITEALDYE